MQEYAKTIDEAQQASHVFRAAPDVPPLKLLLQFQGQPLRGRRTVFLYQREQPPYYFASEGMRG